LIKNRSIDGDGANPKSDLEGASRAISPSYFKNVGRIQPSNKKKVEKWEFDPKPPTIPEIADRSVLSL